jgi:hypothetical protein
MDRDAAIAVLWCWSLSRRKSRRLIYDRLPSQRIHSQHCLQQPQILRCAQDDKQLFQLLKPASFRGLFGATKEAEEKVRSDRRSFDSVCRDYRGKLRS